MKKAFLYFCLILSGFTFGSFTIKHHMRANQTVTDSLVTLPMGGNSWRTDAGTRGGEINDDGIVNWTDSHAEFTTYVRLGGKGKFRIWLNCKVADGESRIAVSIFNSSKEITINNSQPKDYDAGEWTATDTGYIAIKVKVISKTGNNFADISAIKLSGPAVTGKTAFVKNNDGNLFYWGRRGPSVHLNYTVPTKTNVEWFYNEVTVPPGNDVMHSYFMADGFNEGYFGMQVNSPTERHILFSVWSPFKTDKPSDIPDSAKILMLKKGTGVHTGEFGNEGSGGQSYLNFMWKAGTTYRFLMHARPDGHNHTVYTAYFFAPEVGKWQLIASFSRPQTNTWLKHLHSFLENFDPKEGPITREVYFTNQWIADDNGNWKELNQAKFTTDNTGKIGYRMDYAGGLHDNAFYLKNCGFFNDYTVGNTLFAKPVGGKAPEAKLDELP